MLKIDYVDYQELPYVLNALIKQNLYITANKSNINMVEQTKYKIDAEITKIKHIKRAIRPMLTSLKKLYESKSMTYDAYSQIKNLDIDETNIDETHDMIESTIAKLKLAIAKAITDIIPELTYGVIDSWLDSCDECYNKYKDALIKWCDMPFELNSGL